MRSLRVRVWPVAVIALGASALVALQSPAEAAVTITNITTPLDGAHYTVGLPPHATVPVTGTSNGTGGELLEIRCYTVGSSDWQGGAATATVQGDGSFATTMSVNGPYGTCRLRAVPVGFPAGGSLTGFTGPRVTNEFRWTRAVSGGPNDGKVYEYNVAYQGEHAIFDIVSATSSGYWDSRLNYPDGSSSNYLWDSDNASLRALAGETRSRIRVDGRDAYGPYSSQDMLSTSIPGMPSLTHSVTRDGVTGITKITEKNPLVRCPVGTAYPPTEVTCPSFVTTGVRLERSYVVTDGGRQVHLTDVWRSTDGKPHTISARYHHEVHGFDYVTDADTDVALKLPWLGGFQTFTGDATYPGPSKLANSILLRDSNTAPDGDTLLPRGALTFDFPASVHRSDYDTFTLQASTFTVPAKGSRKIRESLVIGTTDASVLAKATANETRINPYRADGQIKKSGAASFKGNNIYNTTGASQGSSANVKRTKSITFVIAVQNDGTRTQTFKIKGNSAPPGFAAKYLAGATGSTSVTSAVVAGTHRLRNIAPGAKKYLRLVVTVKAGTPIGALRSWLVTATPVSDSTRKDVVKATVKVVS